MYNRFSKSFRFGGGGRATHAGQQDDGTRHHDVHTAAAASCPRHPDVDEDDEAVARSVLHELAIPSEDHRLRNSYERSSPSGGQKVRDKDGAATLEDVEGRKSPPKATNKQLASPYNLNFAIDHDSYRSNARERMDSALENLNQAREKVRSTLKRVEELTEDIPALKDSVDTCFELATETAQSLLDELLEDDSAWNIQYRLLEEWYNQHGTTKLPWKKEWKRENPELAKLSTWLIQQRKDYRATRNGTAGNLAMEPYKILALERLDVAWDPYDADWNSRYCELQRYKQEHGNCQVPILNDKRNDPQSTKYNSLGVWCKRQRQQYRAYQLGDTAKTKNMTQERINKLEELGFDWTENAEFESDESFEAHVWELKNFKDKYGHYKVTPKKDAPLAAWLKAVLAKFKRFEKQHEGCGLRVLQYETIKELKIHGQNTIEAVFDIRIAELTEFVKTFGHGNVPFDFVQNPELGNFVANQRQQWKKFKAGRKSSMTDEREKQLMDAGFEFEMTRERRRATKIGQTAMSWDDMFSQYAMFQKDARREFAKSNAANEFPQIQRLDSSDGGGTPHNTCKQTSTPGPQPEIAHLNGDDGNPRVLKKISFEDSNPRLSSKRGKSLLWAEEQRVQYVLNLWGKESTLTKEQIDKLNSIEFDWKLSGCPSVGWDEMFARLLEVRLKTGSFDVPVADNELRDWLSVQITELPKFERGIPCSITKNQIQKLDNAGFPWRSKVPRTDPTKKVLKTWEEYYSELLMQRIKRGSFDFPDEQIALKLWMDVQRRIKVKFENEQLNRSAILEHRICQLTDIGFPWEPTDRIGRRVKPKAYSAYPMPIDDLLCAGAGEGPLVREVIAAIDLDAAMKGPRLIDPEDPYGLSPIAPKDLTEESTRVIQQIERGNHLLRFEASSAVFADEEKRDAAPPVETLGTAETKEDGVLTSPLPTRRRAVQTYPNPPPEEDFDALLASHEFKYRSKEDRKRKAVELTEDDKHFDTDDTKRRGCALPTTGQTDNFTALLESREKRLLALTRSG